MLADAIASLEAEGFDVLRSTNAENSMFQLSRWAQRVAQEVRAGKLTIQYTFEEFKEQVRKIPRQTDFSRLAKDYKERKDKETKLAAALPAAPAAKKESTAGVAKAKADTTAKPVETTGEDIVDLCSDDEAENDFKDRKPSAGQHRKRSREASPKAKSLLSDISLRRTSRFKPFEPSDEVRDFFNDNGDNDKSGDSDSDSDSDGDSATARAKKSIAKYKRQKQRMEEKKRKSALQEESQRSTKKQKITPTRAQAPPGRAPPPRVRETKVEVAKEDKQNAEFEDWSISDLKAECESYGLPKGGTKAALIERLEGPKPPKVLMERKKIGEYVPARHDIASAALLSGWLI